MNPTERRSADLVAPASEIIENEDQKYVIIGSHGYGSQMPQEAVMRLKKSLEGVEALKMEGEGMDKVFSEFNPMSPEIICRTFVKPETISYIKESGHEDMGQKLLRYGVPQEILEVFVPFMVICYQRGMPANFFNQLPQVVEYYKQRFGLLNTENVTRGFWKVSNYWIQNQLAPEDMLYFSSDFEMFIGDVREYELWKPDIEAFRKEQKGKIAICCGSYHAPFVKAVLNGEEVEKPDWENHLEKRRPEEFTEKKKTELKRIYKDLYKALDLQ